MLYGLNQNEINHPNALPDSIAISVEKSIVLGLFGLIMAQHTDWAYTAPSALRDTAAR